MYKKYDLTVAKTINLNTVERPCYEGEDYNDQEYLRLADMIRTEVGCTSPFVPPQLRAVFSTLIALGPTRLDSYWSRGS